MKKGGRWLAILAFLLNSCGPDINNKPGEQPTTETRSASLEKRIEQSEGIQRNKIEEIESREKETEYIENPNYPKRINWKPTIETLRKDETKYLSWNKEGPISQKERVSGHEIVFGYRIQNINNVNNSNMFVYGIQACTGIAGIDDESRIAFISHFNYQDADIERALEEIESSLKRINKKTKIETMSLYIAGGVKHDERSKANALIAIKELIEKYKVPTEKINKYQTGDSYSISLINGKIKIFKFQGNERNYCDYFFKTNN